MKKISKKLVIRMERGERSGKYISKVEWGGLVFWYTKLTMENWW